MAARLKVGITTLMDKRLGWSLGVSCALRLSDVIDPPGLAWSSAIIELLVVFFNE
jgi:hypothetical protein